MCSNTNETPNFQLEEYLIEGAILQTKNSSALSNAILAKIVEDRYIVLTDFGNILELSKKDLFAHYQISITWINCYKLDYPFPSVKNRILEQIENLERASRTLDLLN